MGYCWGWGGERSEGKKRGLWNSCEIVAWLYMRVDMCLWMLFVVLGEAFCEMEGCVYVFSWLS